ncbi:MAG TPA: DUF4037 domain-containing protein [Micromonosporaceae bacterium]|nr:DUF4037 domain-containing protein [Micromonosporaceae bacterium]
MTSGCQLAGRFYREVVAPLLAGAPHAAALLGEGSEVLGYDDEVSTDHSFGPRVQLFLSPDADPGPVHARLDRLPQRFAGYPVAFPYVDRHDGRPHHQVEVTTVAAFFTGRLGTDPAARMDLGDWLLAPTQRLATLTRGAVFHDPDGELAARRAVLAWYPDDVWRYVLAAGWLRVGQEEPFVGRAGGRGDDLGSAVVGARLVRDLIRLAFLVERCWAPYSKWLGHAFGQLRLAAVVGPCLRAALRAPGWREREAALCEAASRLGAATNRLGLAAEVDPAPRQFYTRDVRVVHAERFTAALTAAVTDPQVRSLLDRLGYRAGSAVGALPGAVDQAVDSVDVLSYPDRCQAAAALLGLHQR